MCLINHLQYKCNYTRAVTTYLYVQYILSIAILIRYKYITRVAASLIKKCTCMHAAAGGGVALNKKSDKSQSIALCNCWQSAVEKKV